MNVLDLGFIEIRPGLEFKMDLDDVETEISSFNYLVAFIADGACDG